MLIYHGRYTEGLQLLERWNEFSFSAAVPDVGNQAIILSCFAWAKIGRGDLAGAEAMADRAVQIMRDARADDRPFATVPVVPLAWVAWERGDLDAAEALITRVMDRITRLGEIPAYVYAHTLLARIHHSQGRHQDAHRALDTATVAPDGSPLAGYFAALVAMERTRLALLNQDLPAAERALPDWRTRRDHGAATMFEHHLLTRLTIAFGGDPAPLLDQPPTGLDVTPADHIEQHKLRALQSLHDGDETQALEHLAEAMKIAAQTGHRRTLLDEAATFGAVLDNAGARTGYPLATHRRPLPTPPSTVATPALVEPLTERELEILRLLPTHLTYQQIADELFVSPNTIKSYIKNIYRKLEADKRSDAVTTANSLGLI
jgi:LuxR family maltose regulon positive regulatory protein